MESGDFSPLQPMSVRDTIWITVAQQEKHRQEMEVRKLEREIEIQDQKVLCLILADIRHILRDADWYTRITACKDSKKMIQELKPMPVSDLPSMLEEKEREAKEAEEAMKHMSREERIAFKVNRLKEGKEIS